MRIEWGAASAADIDAFYGERPSETLKAIIIKLDGDPAGIIGLAIERHRARAFSEYKPALEPFLTSMPVLRAIKAAQKMFSHCVRPVFAICEKDPAILERLGFEKAQDEVYQWRS